MHQESWIYRGKFKRHLLQLSHDFSNGNLVLTLDGFKLSEEVILESEDLKIFSFFIDGELFEIKITRQNKQFVYEFIPHVYSTSHVGKTRKKAAKWELLSVNTGITIIVIALLSAILYFTFFSNDAAPPLSLGGLTAVATITEINANKEHLLKTEDGKTKSLRGNIRYKFKVLDEWYYGDAYLYKKMDFYYLAKTGLPIQTGDEFMVLYSENNPNNNHILFDHPSEQKLAQYQLMARESCLKNLPPNIPTDKELTYCECLKAYLFQQYDLKGLANMIHQTKSKTAFEDFNEKTYQKFMNESRQQEIQKNCLDQLF
ncbi:MAG: hypothetical protein R3E32_01290 [Chitinophagales bacterium]